MVANKNSLTSKMGFTVYFPFDEVEVFGFLEDPVESCNVLLEAVL